MLSHAISARWGGCQRDRHWSRSTLAGFQSNGSIRYVEEDQRSYGAAIGWLYSDIDLMRDRSRLNTVNYACDRLGQSTSAPRTMGELPITSVTHFDSR